MTDLQRSPADRSRPLPEVLSSLAHQAATGVLSVHAGEVRRELVLSSGEIQAARSTLDNEKLGGWLVERGLITNEELALILLKQSGPDAMHFGRLLLEGDLLDRMILEQELQDLSLAIIERAMAAPEIRCEFVADHGRDQPDTLPGLTTAQLILIAARAFADLEAKQSSIGSLERPAWPADTLEALYEEIDLTPEEAFVVSRAGGSRSLAEVIKVSPLGPDQAISTVYALKVAGILELGEIPEATDRPWETQKEAAETVAAPPDEVDEGAFSDLERKERARIRELAARLHLLDHYEIFDVPANAPPEAIADVWRTMRDIYHPDRSQEPHLGDLGQALAAIRDQADESFQVLSDPASRTRYDVLRDEVVRDRRPTPTTQEKAPEPPPAEETVEEKLARSDALLDRDAVGPAIRVLEEACDLDPRPAELLKLARLLLRDPAMTNRALSTLRRAVVADPGFVDAWLELAAYWRGRGKPDLEQKALQRALRADPDNPDASGAYRRLTGGRGLKGFLRRLRRRIP